MDISLISLENMAKCWIFFFFKEHLPIFSLKLCITYENHGCDIQKCGYLFEGLNVICPNLSRIVYHLTKL